MATGSRQGPVKGVPGGHANRGALFKTPDTCQGLGMRLPRFVAVSAFVLVPGCMLFAPSEEEIQNDYEAFVASRRSCDATEDCVMAVAGCPLGCGTAVNKASRAAVEKKARELIADHERGGASCDYDCGQQIAVCTEGRCEEVAP